MKTVSLNGGVKFDLVFSFVYPDKNEKFNPSFANLAQGVDDISKKRKYYIKMISCSFLVYTLHYFQKKSYTYFLSMKTWKKLPCLALTLYFCGLDSGNPCRTFFKIPLLSLINGRDQARIYILRIWTIPYGNLEMRRLFWIFRLMCFSLF